MKRKLLLHSDSVCAGTGFGRVAQMIVEALDDWDVVQIAINHPGPLVEHERVKTIMAQASGDVYGFPLVRELYLEGDFDMLVVIQDLHIASGWGSALSSAAQLRALRRMKPCPILFHYPVDGPITKAHTGMLRTADRLVSCTRWGNDVLSDFLPGTKPDVVQHSVDTDVFKPLSSDQRAQARRAHFGEAASDLCVLVVATNTDRKDLPTALRAIRLLNEDELVARIRLHTKPIQHGMNLHQVAENLELSSMEMRLSPSAQMGMPPDTLNELYNAADCVLFTSRREGFGIPMIEAMAAGVAVVAPDYGPFAEVMRPEASMDLGYFHETMGDIIWIRGDDRGPSWQCHPERVADALRQVDKERHTAPFRQCRREAREHMVQRYALGTIKEKWRRLLYDTLRGMR